jgi:hypothetical protein
MPQDLTVSYGMAGITANGTTIASPDSSLKPDLRYSQGYLTRPQVQSRISHTLGTVWDIQLEMGIFYPTMPPSPAQTAHSSQTSGTVKDVRYLGYSLGYTA